MYTNVLKPEGKVQSVYCTPTYPMAEVASKLIAAYCAVDNYKISKMYDFMIPWAVSDAVAP